MKKIIITLGIIFFVLSNGICKDKYRSPTLEPGFAAIKISDTTYLMAAGGLCQIVKGVKWEKKGKGIGVAGDVRGIDSSCKVEGETIKCGDITTEPAGGGAHYNYLRSRTIALIPYKNFYYWVVEMVTEGGRQLVVKTLYIRQSTLNAEDATYNLIDMKTCNVGSYSYGDSEKFGAFVLGDKFYITTSDGTEGNSDSFLLHCYDANKSGNPYFDFESQTEVITQTIQKPQNSGNSLIAIGAYPNEMEIDATGEEVVTKVGHLLTVWNTSREYGVVLASYDYSISEKGYNTTDTTNEEHITGYKSSYYCAQILPFPLASRSEKGNEYNIIIGFYKNSLTNYGKVWTYRVTFDDNLVEFHGGNDDNQISDGVYSCFNNFSVIVQTKPGAGSSAENPCLDIYMDIINYDSEFGINMYLYKIQKLELNKKKDDDTKINDKLIVGYLKSIPPTDSESNEINVSDREFFSGSDAQNEFFEAGGIVPIGVVYFPPIAIPNTPDDISLGNGVKKATREEIINNRVVLQKLWMNETFDEFSAWCNVYSEQKVNPLRYEWLYKGSLYGNGTIFWKGLHDNVKWSMESSSTDGKSFSVSQCTAISSELGMGGDKAIVKLAVSAKREVDQVNSEGKNVTRGNAQKITATDSGYFSDINKNAVLIYWEYNRTCFREYSFELMKDSINPYAGNPVLSSVITFLGEPPSISMCSFDPTMPNSEKVKDVRIRGIKAVPMSYNVLNEKNEPAQAEKKTDPLTGGKIPKYDYLLWWNDILINGDPFLEKEYYIERGLASVATDVDNDWSISTKTSEESKDTRIKSGGIATEISGGVLGIKLKGGVTHSTSVTCSESTSADSIIKFNLALQKMKVNSQYEPVVIEGIQYTPYMISEIAPRKDENDWWVSRLCRAQGRAPWVLYYSSGNVRKLKGTRY